MFERQDPQGHQLLDRARQGLHQTAQLQLHVDAVEQKGADAVVTVRRNDGTQYGPWFVELKRTLQKKPLAALAAQIAHGPQPGLLVTDYVNPRQAHTLRELDLAFIDTAGNAYLHDGEFLVYITGRAKPVERDLAPRVRAFRPTELKLILLMLCDPEAVTAPYRALAERVDIALGNVAHTVKKLEAQGYLVRVTRRERHLVNRRELLDRWVTDYIAKLRPGLVMGRYEARKANWWHDNPPLNDDGQWGGEVAADHWTGYLKPGTATVYVDNNPARLLAKYALAKDPQGKTEILQRFWPDDISVERHYVPPIIAYADLLAIGGARNMEAAKELYEAKLAADFTDP